MGKLRTLLACSECGQQLAQWTGRCPGCGAWGTIRDGHPAGTGRGGVATATLTAPAPAVMRVPTELEGVDRVLGGGVLPGSVTLVAGEPGTGKATLPPPFVLPAPTRSSGSRRGSTSPS